MKILQKIIKRVLLIQRADTAVAKYIYCEVNMKEFAYYQLRVLDDLVELNLKFDDL